MAQSALDSFNGEEGSTIWAVNKRDGARQAAWRLESRPVFDGLIATQGRLFLTTADSKALCLGPGAAQPLPPASDSTAVVSPSAGSSAGQSPASAKPRKAGKADKPAKAGGKRGASGESAA